MRWTTQNTLQVTQRDNSWFAWHPVTLESQDGKTHWVWWERVIRISEPYYVTGNLELGTSRVNDLYPGYKYYEMKHEHS